MAAEIRPGPWGSRLAAMAVWAWVIALFATAAFVVVVIRRSPTNDLPAWSALGEVFQGLGAIALAVGTAVASVSAVLAYFRQRGEELRLRVRQGDTDLAHLVGEQVRILALLADQASDAGEKRVYLGDLVKAAQVYRALLEGLVRSRPDLEESELNGLLAGLERVVDNGK